MNYLKLIRFPNLVIIALIQYVMRYCVIQPILGINKMELQLSKLDFFFPGIFHLMYGGRGLCN